MNTQAIYKSITLRDLLYRIIVFIIFFSYENCYSQNYRSAAAYINDFSKNEMYINRSLMEYSLAVINDSPEERKRNTIEQLFTKLENINSNLLRNDRGFAGDTDMRDAFIYLNTQTLALFKNNSLLLNDYEVQSDLDYVDIFRNFAYKEIEIKKYYAEIGKYEQKVAAFGLKHKVIVTTNNKTNVFEYHAYHSLIYYKINVLDVKLSNFLKEKNTDMVRKCMDYIIEIGSESLLKTALLRSNFADASLNDANAKLIKFIMQQNEAVLPFYELYVKTSNDFQTIKTKFKSNTSDITTEEYNAQVRNYNTIKNNFFKVLNENELKKINLLTLWQVTNSTFLKRHIEFEKLSERSFKEK